MRKLVLSVLLGCLAIVAISVMSQQPSGPGGQGSYNILGSGSGGGAFTNLVPGFNIQITTNAGSGAWTVSTSNNVTYSSITVTGGTAGISISNTVGAGGDYYNIYTNAAGFWTNAEKGIFGGFTNGYYWISNTVAASVGASYGARGETNYAWSPNSILGTDGATAPGEVTLAVGAGLAISGGTTLIVSGNGGLLNNLNGGAITGAIPIITWKAIAIRPGDTLPMTWSTNTPGTTYNLLQGAGLSFLGWQVSTSGTNNGICEFKMPPDYAAGGYFTGAVSVLSATNFNVKTTNVWSFAGARVGTALGTAATFTNNLPITTSTCNTNWRGTVGFLLAGTPQPGDDCYIQVQPWGGSPYWTSTNTEWLMSVSVTYQTTNTVRQNLTYP